MYSSEHETLLNEALAEDGYPEFREKLRHDLTRQFRAQHRKLKPGWWWALAACMAFGVVAWQFSFRGIGRYKPAEIASLPTAEPAAPWIVQTKPLGPNLVVSSTLGEGLVVSSRPQQLEIVETKTAPETVVSGSFSEIVSTSKEARLEFVNDTELLNLFPECAVGFTKDLAGRRQFFVVNCAEKTRAY